MRRVGLAVASGQMLRAAPVAVSSNALDSQQRFAAKLATGYMKGRKMRQGKGRPQSKKYGWKVMPGNIVETGYEIIKTKMYSNIAVDDFDDELPFNVHPGANTFRTGIGQIIALTEGTVRVSKLPGTEGTADKVFVWVDPNVRQNVELTRRRHSHKEFNNEFFVDELDANYAKDPKWTHKGDTNHKDTLKEWPYNPEWDLPKSQRDFSRRPPAPTGYEETEREIYQRTDNEMFWNRIAQRPRHYRFGGETYEYEGVFADRKSDRPDPWTAFNFESASDARNKLAQPWHDGKATYKRQMSVYQVPTHFGKWFL
eukprot:Hpha_TRINITY_DN31718_c0_g1::TRINITY_DN31718_c0_g1_i1::g.116450::m.116450